MATDMLLPSSSQFFPAGELPFASARVSLGGATAARLMMAMGGAQGPLQPIQEERLAGRLSLPDARARELRGGARPLGGGASALDLGGGGGADGERVSASAPSSPDHGNKACAAAHQRCLAAGKRRLAGELQADEGVRSSCPLPHGIVAGALGAQPGSLKDKRPGSGSAMEQLLQGEIERLASSNSDLAELLAAARSGSTTSQQQLAAALEQLADAQDQIVALRARLAEAAAQLVERADLAAALRAELASSDKARAGLAEQLDRLADKVGTQEGQLEYAHKQLDAAQAEARAQGEAAAAATAAGEQLAAQLDAAREELAATRRELDGVTSRLSSEATDAKRAGDESSGLRRDLAQLQAELSRARQDASEARERARQAQADGERRVAQLEGERAELAQQLGALRDRAAALQAQHDRAREALAAAEGDNATLRGDVAALLGCRQELVEARDRLRQLQLESGRRAAELEAAAADLSQQLAFSRAQGDRRAQQLAAAEANCGALHAELEAARHAAQQAAHDAALQKQGLLHQRQAALHQQQAAMQQHVDRLQQQHQQQVQQLQAQLDRALAAVSASAARVPVLAAMAGCGIGSYDGGGVDAVGAASAHGLLDHGPLSSGVLRGQRKLTFEDEALPSSPSALLAHGHASPGAHDAPAHHHATYSWSPGPCGVPAQQQAALGSPGCEVSAYWPAAGAGQGGDAAPSSPPASPSGRAAQLPQQPRAAAGAGGGDTPWFAGGSSGRTPASSSKSAAPASPGASCGGPGRPPSAAAGGRPGPAPAGAGASPFGTDMTAAQLAAHTKQLEDDLLVLCQEKDELLREHAKMPLGSGRTIREKQRKAAIEARLEELAVVISRTRMALKRALGNSPCRLAALLLLACVAAGADARRLLLRATPSAISAAADAAAFNHARIAAAAEGDGPAHEATDNEPRMLLSRAEKRASRAAFAHEAAHDAAHERISDTASARVAAFEDARPSLEAERRMLISRAEKRAQNAHEASLDTSAAIAHAASGRAPAFEATSPQVAARLNSRMLISRAEKRAQNAHEASLHTSAAIAHAASGRAPVFEATSPQLNARLNSRLPAADIGGRRPAAAAMLKNKSRSAVHRGHAARLLKQIKKREAQLRRLAEERDAIAPEHDLLQAYVNTMGWIRQHLEGQQLAAAAESGDASGPLQLAASELGADGEELLLLEQLRAASLSCGPRAGAACQPTAPEHSSSDGDNASELGHAAAAAAYERMAPPHDPLRLARHILSQPAPPEALTMTVEGLKQRHDEIVRRAAVALHQLDAAGPLTGSSPPLEQLHELAMQWIVLLGQMILCGRNNVVLARHGQHDAERVAHACRAVGLSPDQVRDIVAGLKVFRRVHAPITSKLCQLFTEVGLPPPGAAGAGAGAGGEALLASSMLQHLGREEVRAERLREVQLLLAKFGLLGGIAGAQLFGVLSCHQFARLQVLLHPHTVSAVAFAGAVVEAYAQPAPAPVLKQEP
ncbi:hypothetical protein HT031_000736 [Scenedesmus sp. PABB004]|nr:hypothetical protein HT031_000736 [Scenedesmus sp. PABB004]